MIVVADTSPRIVLIKRKLVASAILQFGSPRIQRSYPQLRRLKAPAVHQIITAAKRSGAIKAPAAQPPQPDPSGTSPMLGGPRIERGLKIASSSTASLRALGGTEIPVFSVPGWYESHGCAIKECSGK